MKTKLLTVALLLQFWAIYTLAQQSMLQSGPMVGYSTMREVALWVQTKEAADVQIAYWEKGNESGKAYTEKVRTTKEKAFAAHLIADRVEPGKAYTYQLSINNKKVNLPYELSFQTQALWQWRTDAPDFSFALGSCFYVNETQYDRPGKPYGSNYQIVGAIAEAKPDFMLWLGDNTYLREADWNSKTGVYHRYTHTRSLPELQPLLGATHNYAVWDDHDYGPNDSDRSFWLKETTLQAFKDFWANPNYNVTGEGGITGTFHWNDVQFFLLDNRWFRSPNRGKTGERTMLGEAQVQWLLDALASSKASFKFVVMGGQVLNSQAQFENFATYGEEKQRLLQLIRASRVEGVVFLDGDIHHTEVNFLKENRYVYPFFDITVSSLTAGVSRGNNGSRFLVEESVVEENNFGLINISGKRGERVLTLTIHGVDGQELYRKEIKQQELSYGD